MIRASRKGLPVLIASIAAVSAVFAESGEMKPNGCKGPSLCHTRPDIDSNEFMFDIGILAEQMILTGTTYGYTYSGGTTTPTPSDNHVNAHCRRPKFGVDVGVTLGIGRHFDHDDWDLNIQFDWLQSTGKDNTGTEFNEIFIPVNLRTDDALTATTGGDLTFAETASDTLKVSYYMLDVQLSRGNYFTGCFHVTPHMGVKAAWMSYDDDIKLTGGSGQLVTNTYYQTRNSDFWGVGPSFGVDGVWGMSEGFGWFADNSVAILLGSADIADHSWYGASPTTFTNKYNCSNIPVLSPVLSIFIGLQYAKPVYYGCQHIQFKAGWDTTVYFNQNYRSYIYNETPAGNPKFHEQNNDTFGTNGFKAVLTWNF